MITHVAMKNEKTVNYQALIKSANLTSGNLLETSIVIK